MGKGASIIEINGEWGKLQPLDYVGDGDTIAIGLPGPISRQITIKCLFDTDIKSTLSNKLDYIKI
jgi:hypothetical protein